MRELTVKQALVQGYTRFVYSKDGCQEVKLIKDWDIDFNREDIRLCNKTPFHPCKIDGEKIKDLIADIIACNHYDATGDDTQDVYDAIMSIDLSVLSYVSERIQKKLNEFDYYRETEIKLIP